MQNEKLKSFFGESLSGESVNRKNLFTYLPIHLLAMQRSGYAA